MPFSSQKQARYFYAAANKKKGLGDLSQATAQKFIEDTQHQEISKLPKYKKLKKMLKRD